MLVAGASQRPHLAPLLVLVPLVFTACQSAILPDEAKKVAVSLSTPILMPPTRPEVDVTAILDQQPLADPGRVERDRAPADAAPPPENTQPAIFADFYYQRGAAGLRLGRFSKVTDDLELALKYSRQAGGALDYKILYLLGRAEDSGREWSLSARALTYYREAIAAVPKNQSGFLFCLYASQAYRHSTLGDLATTEQAVTASHTLLDQSRQWANITKELRAQWEACTASAEAALFDARGDFVRAEGSRRKAIALLAAHPVLSQSAPLAILYGQLGRTLAWQGRALEAERITREGLQKILSSDGRYSRFTGLILRFLSERLFEQGRYGEAEKVARAAINIYVKLDAPPDSAFFHSLRAALGTTLAAQRRWGEALEEFQTIERAVTPPASRYLPSNVGWAWTLLNTGQPSAAIARLDFALERYGRLLGDEHRQVATIRGLRAIGYRATGELTRALADFAAAARILAVRLEESPGGEDMTDLANGDLRSKILRAYIELLFEIRGTPLEREAGVEAIAEAFRLADIARSQSVQRALDAGAVRAAAPNSPLAGLIREEQDLTRQLGALEGGLLNMASLPTNQQDAAVVTALQSRIDRLREARKQLEVRLAREFPTYAALVNPPAPSVESVRSALRPGEALVSLFVTEERTFAWAIPQSGAMVATTVPVGTQALGETVARLRRALAPSAAMLGDIPPFDVTAAHEVYRTLLAPIAAGWQSARSVLIVANGPLGQLPFTLLPVEAPALGPERGTLFSHYRDIAWLIRSHTVTVLPTATSLVTLRTLPPGDGSRSPFVGFGDPAFNEAQARAMVTEQPIMVAQAADAELAARAPIALRGLIESSTPSVTARELAHLPRLADTADEIRDIAATTGADSARDIFLGLAANEQIVKTLDLARYRVIAFATHGLVPGDLTGLTEPALALSAPSVARIDGDGLLTLEEVLGLRLNAEWVVLSACNTASGNGSGSEALSGLGRAFFYAGARALFVSNWPVETTSARVLTTDLFRRQQSDPRLSRAQALQQTLVSLIDKGELVDARTGRVMFSYAHPIFWSPFSLVGDGG